MASYPESLRYTKEHEWARISGSTATVGITIFAKDQLGDVVYLELPEVGATVTKGQPFGVVESTKAVSELFAPVTGKVTKVNKALVDAPEGAEELLEQLEHARERLELRVQRPVELAVGVGELLGFAGVEVGHLFDQMAGAHAGHQLIVGDRASEHGLRRMPERLEDHPAGVDDRAVEVEEDDRKAH